MGKIYLFNEIEFTSLNELGIAYSQDFEVALNDIFSNTKRLIKFIKSINKKLAKDAVSFFTTCKYKNNVLTFLIFNFCEDKRVLINGNPYDFRKFVDTLRAYGDKHKAIYAFMEDGGISKTFGVLNTEPNLTRDAYFIEKNINDSFVYEYLITYYQYDYVESLHSFISNVFIYNDERFRRSIKVFRNERFQLILSHKAGFKEVFELRHSDMPVFKAVRLLINEFNEKDLQKLLDDTFYWLLWNNLDKYSFKSEAKKSINPVVKKIKKAKGDYDHDPKLPAYIDICEELYELYVDFANLMHNGLIKVKKKFDQEMYALDHLYCNTYISLDYMKNNPVKLQKDNINNPNSAHDFNISSDDLKDDDINPIDLLNEDNDEIEVFVSKKMSKKEIKREEKRINRLKRFTTSSVLFLALFAVVIGALFILEVASPKFADALSLIQYAIVLVFAFVGIVLAVATKFNVGKTDEALSDIVALGRLTDKNVRLTPQQEKAIIKFKENENNNLIKAKRIHRAATTVILTIVAFVSAATAICAFSLSSGSMGFPKDWANAYTDNKLNFIYLMVAPLAGLAYGILRKKKGFKTTLLMIIIAFASVFLLSLVL